MFSLFKQSKVQNQDDFKSILSVASTILNSENPHRIYDLIYSLGKPYQFQIINYCIKDFPISGDDAFSIEHLFFKNNHKHYRLTKENEHGDILNYNNHNKKNTLHPSEDIILTFPWNISRLENAFKHIGAKVGNTWKHDSLNHQVVHIFPLNIGYIINGNHSTVMNVINNEAPMIITSTLDLTPVYDEIYTDGQHFRDHQSNKIIDEVSSVEFAAIFEIGRRILNR